MTIEEFEQASEIYRKYDEIEDIIERIKEAREEKLQIDERTKKDRDDHKKWWQKLRFFSLRLKEQGWWLCRIMSLHMESRSMQIRNLSS